MLFELAVLVAFLVTFILMTAWLVGPAAPTAPAARVSPVAASVAAMLAAAPAPLMPAARIHPDADSPELGLGGRVVMHHGNLPAPSATGECAGARAAEAEFGVDGGAHEGMQAGVQAPNPSSSNLSVRPLRITDAALRSRM